MKIQNILFFLFFTYFNSFAQDFYLGTSVDLNLQTSILFGGNVSIANGSSFSSTPNSIMLIKGDLTTNGQLTNSGTIKFDNALEKNVSGPLISSKLVLESGSSINLSGSGDLRVTDSLTLFNGKIKTNTNIVELGTSVSNLGVLNFTTGFIEGNFKRWFDASLVSNVLFPLGKTSLYVPVEISFTLAPTSGGALLAKHILNTSNPLISTTLTDGLETITNVSEMNIWQIDALNGITGGEYLIKLNSNLIYGVLDQTALRIVKRSGTYGSWVLEGSHVSGTGTITSPNVFRSGLTSFSQFAIGSPSLNPLPITLTKFVSNCKTDGIILDWQTASEHNTDRFSLKKSFDGITWIEIASIQAAGNSDEVINYSFLDKTSINRICYYKLFQIDVQGLEVEYETISANCVFEETSAVNLYPNPSSALVNISLNLKTESDIIINVLSLYGKVVYTYTGYSVAGNLILPINFDYCLPGLYQVEVILNDEKFSDKLIIL